MHGLNYYSDSEEEKEVQDSTAATEELPAERQVHHAHPPDQAVPDAAVAAAPNRTVDADARDAVRPLDGSASFGEIIDAWIQRSARTGDGPPPEYKAEIMEVYDNAPPEGQEQMRRDMLEMVLNMDNEDNEDNEAPEELQVQGVPDASLDEAEMPSARSGVSGVRSGSPADRPRGQVEEQARVAAEQKAAVLARMGVEPSAPPVPEKPLEKNVVQVFFEIAVDGAWIGRIEFDLFADVVPRTVENFRCLCSGEMGRSSKTKQRLSFEGSTFHRIIPSFMCQGGDFTRGDGTGGESIYGEKFEDENFQLKHKKGCLSMANAGPNSNGSQFFICLDATPHLDGKHVVFGEVVQGFEVVEKMETLGSRSGRVAKKVTIMSCGQVGSRAVLILAQRHVSLGIHLIDFPMSSAVCHVLGRQ